MPTSQPAGRVLSLPFHGQRWLCALGEGWGSSVGSLLHLSPTERRALLLLQEKSLCSKLRFGTKALGMALDVAKDPRAGIPASPSSSSALAMLVQLISNARGRGPVSLYVIATASDGLVGFSPRLLARPWRVSDFHSELGHAGTHLSHPPGAHRPTARQGSSARLHASLLRFSPMEISALQPALHWAGGDRAQRQHHFWVGGRGGGR